MTETRTSPTTRFAPSPTGYLHIGGARTALFSWAYARRHSGQFLLRIEDTDRERSTEESERAVIEGLRWLGIEWDGPIHRQSDAYERHQAVIEELLADGKAYRCVCTRGELDERKQAHIARGEKWTYDRKCRGKHYGADCGPHVVRLALPDTGMLDWQDGVYGPSGQDASEIGDVIIRRSDGTPLYHLAVVVDDIDLGVTHILRGQDHHSNTPIQLAIYRALGVTPPAISHVPLIVGSDGKKLSKRRDPVAVQQFREEGYLPEAMRNWLVRIGWSHGDQEVFSLEEVTQFFDLEHISRSSARADLDKLVWLNQHYLRTLPIERVREHLLPFLEKEAGKPIEWTSDLERYVEIDRERPKTLVEFAQRLRFLIVEPITYDENAVKKHLKPAIADALAALRDAFARLPAWEEGALEEAFEQVLAAHGDMKKGKLAQPLRVAVTGGSVSAGIQQTLVALGRERSLARIADALERIRAKA